MFPRHRSKVSVRETGDTGSGIISLVEQESFKIVHRHRFEDFREVDRFHKIVNHNSRLMFVEMFEMEIVQKGD